MKKVISPIIFLIFLSILSFVTFTLASNNILTKEEALKLGEEKYLKFLWMVDGAFNSEQYNEEYIVNDKSLGNNDKIFTCIYQNKNDKECISNNFTDEFNKLFSKNIKYDDVYSDGIMYSWYKLKDDKYVFNVLESCDVKRMNSKQRLSVIKINNNSITYEVSIDDDIKDFILIYEDDEWKISKAFYHDLCELRYNIG